MKAPELAFWWNDQHGKEVTRKITTLIDTGEFVGAPGRALLVIAANRHLSIGDLRRLLLHWGIERSTSWIQRRRWLFQDPATVNSAGTKANADGKDNRAIAIMQEYPTVSVIGLSRLLAKHGIKRSREWVRRHRCDTPSPI